MTVQEEVAKIGQCFVNLSRLIKKYVVRITLVLREDHWQDPPLIYTFGFWGRLQSFFPRINYDGNEGKKKHYRGIWKTTEIPGF
jgi:hypothetical protein